MDRVDKRGRRIGWNWWREYNVGLVHEHNDNVEKHREDNHQMEPEEFAAANPLLTLKECLIANAGMQREPDEAG